MYLLLSSTYVTFFAQEWDETNTRVPILLWIIYLIFFLLKKAAAETKTKAETLADLSKQWDTEDEDMEETETPAGTAPEPTPETGAPEEAAAPAPAVALEEEQETAMETEQVKS